MAKEAPKAAKEEKPKKDEGLKYGINDLADLLDIEPASVRVKLRAKGIKKVGGRYGWETKAELQEVAAELKSAKEEKPEGKKAGKKGKKDADDGFDPED